MKEIPASLKTHLAGPATTVASCWRLTRADGAVLGFTDHDETLSFEGTSFQAASGLTAGEAEAELGLAAGSQDVEGALSSLAIDEGDIAAGRYDGARVETFLVNWQAVADRLLTDVFELGEVKRGGPAFTCELRGIASQLDRRRGRLYRRRCDAVLGDRRCRADVAAAPYVADGSLLRQAGGALFAAGLDGTNADLFAQGSVSFLSGAAAGLKREIASFRKVSGTAEVRIAFVDDTVEGLLPGDRLRIHAGCDKSYGTCRARFNNGLNFRGFPHLPGNDAAMGFAKTDGQHDGSPVVP